MVYTDKSAILVVSVFYLTTVLVQAWTIGLSSWMTRTRTEQCRVTFFPVLSAGESSSSSSSSSSSFSTTGSNDDATIMGKREIETTPDSVYGVSFMGGDPCGSKYNDDPFDATKDTKPGFPEDMKARIAALAEQQKKEMKEKKID